MICQVCNNPFEAKRSTAKFCSEACKQKNKRHGKRDTVTQRVYDTLKNGIAEVGVNLSNVEVNEDGVITSAKLESVSLIKDCVHDICPRTCPNYGVQYA